ncbi:MAG: putative zinc-binding protein [Ferruginibacter sp.]|nr:putative zinc-binding protein [Ferruginibacter sp.]
MKRIQRLWLNIKINIIWWPTHYFLMAGAKKAKGELSFNKKSTCDKPLVYSCSGCSSAAQMANYLAVRLDRNGLAEMSCIVGVGGNVKKLVHTALSGRGIITIDGCPLACSKACLGNHLLQPAMHFELTSMGVKKIQHEDFDLFQADAVFNVVKAKVAAFTKQY